MNNESSLPDGTWTIDPNASTVTVTVMKMKVMSVPATLTVMSGTITIAGGKVGQVEVVADAASYKSSTTLRDKEVLKANFLDAVKYPTITFTASDGSADRVEGQVAMKGTTAPLTFDISALNIDGNAATFTAKAKVDRTAVGVTKMPSFIVGKELDIEVQVKATS